MTNYYQTLGIDNTANNEDIKRAYRKMAMRHHPDRGGDQTEFQKIQEAYSVLSDPAKRQQYDNPQPQPQFHHFHGGGGVPPGFEELFRQFGVNFGFGSPFQQQPRNRTLNLQTTISLEDSLNGKEIVANITLPNSKENIVNVKIPPGIQDNNTLRLRELGDDSVPGMPRGDVHLTVHIAPHRVFQRSGDDLIKEVENPINSNWPIDSVIKLCGFENIESFYQFIETKKSNKTNSTQVDALATDALAQLDLLVQRE